MAEDMKSKSRGINVLSLCDGMGTCAYVLGLIGVKINDYLAVDPDDDAKRVFHNLNPSVEANHTWKTDVFDIGEEDIAALGWGYLQHLVAAPTCEDFSLMRLLRSKYKHAKKKGRPGLAGEIGRVFRQVIKIRDWVLKYNPKCEVFIENLPFDDLTEDWREVCNALGEPTVLDAADVSHTRRVRAF